jgi:SSS family solute:Na+ symporter
MSNFTWIDGTIVAIYFIVSMAAGLSVRKYVGKVETFLVAGREMDVYLGVASLAATEFGIVTCMSSAELGYKHGFAGATPGLLGFAAMLLIGLTGFCVKPLRESGVMTIPELFEKRFGPNIRWWSGVVIVLGGLLNMGVFLRTGGEFLVIVCGFHEDYLNITMTVMLVAVGLYTIVGGMLSVLVTDYLQFLVMSVGMLVVTVLTLWYVPWDKLVSTVEANYGAGGFNPLLNENIGWSVIIFQGLVNSAAMLTWQTTIARLLAAKDAKTGQKVYTRTSFFFVCQFLIPGIWGIAALATLAPEVMAGHKPSDAMPLFLANTQWPIGITGLLVAAMLAADMSTDSSYMLTWGSVIYNDLLAPFRRTKWSEKRGLRWNRAIVALIGVFLLIYGLWYPLQQEIWTYLTVTGTIYLASMSTLLIASCYWRPANSWGAAAAIAVGASLPLAYLVCEQIPATRELALRIGAERSGIAAFVGAGVAMVVGSYVKPNRRETATNSAEGASHA